MAAPIRDTALSLKADAFPDLQVDQLEDAGGADVVFDVIGADVSAARPLWCAPAARSSPSPHRPRPNPVPGGLSSSSNPIEPGSRISPSDSGTDASSQSSGPCGRSGKRLPRSPRPAYTRQDDHQVTELKAVMTGMRFVGSNALSAALTARGDRRSGSDDAFCEQKASKGRDSDVAMTAKTSLVLA